MAYTVALTVACLVNINKFPKVDISFFDKIFHSITYLVLTLLWFSTFFFNFNYKRSKALLYAAGFSSVFGIIIEVLQGVLTVNRSADIYDVLANSLGVLLAGLFIILKRKTAIKN
ncbi:VanZ family protein [Siansivirga zeaxanthinifaciens]|uniref:VanZ-like domain-containing protein n=1 Tax=Siansivirga zeaxanthinifaciens CC-SAMT-1 TaxID=1454006 RepID=A0A0C5W7P9_9FLAO|nr:VanZ family protein [Siansivirga zeaxanthinifaciens]AJR03173.1 hypothetical protein AW14_05455 [Siansivirga zeaxanthinifaciens CC-SAMT-1]